MKMNDNKKTPLRRFRMKAFGKKQKQPPGPNMRINSVPSQAFTTHETTLFLVLMHFH